MPQIKKIDSSKEGYRGAIQLIELYGIEYVLDEYKKAEQVVALHAVPGNFVTNPNPSLHFMRQVEKYVAFCVASNSPKGYATTRAVKAILKGEEKCPTPKYRHTETNEYVQAFGSAMDDGTASTGMRSQGRSSHQKSSIGISSRILALRDLMTLS